MNIPLAVAPDTLYGHDVFGYARLKDVLDANTKAPLSELKSAVLRAVHQHTKKGLTHDDVTLIALEIC
jgi:serine phosphatase RsbU (regulator of sigma subunit)